MEKETAKKIAQNNGVMPDGLSPSEQAFFQATRFLTQAYRLGDVSAELAASEMKKIQAAFEKQRRKELEVERFWSAWERCEAAAVSYHRYRSEDTATALYKAVKSMPQYRGGDIENDEMQVKL